jgi:hypothetical protein
MSKKSPARRHLLLKSWAAITVIWWVFAMGVVANKALWELGPEWCAEYTLVKYMLYMEDSWCSSAPSELSNPEGVTAQIAKAMAAHAGN